MTTIFAQSTPYGKSGIGLYRLSGSKALAVAKMLTKKDHFSARYAHYVNIYDPQSQRLIDQGVVLYFPSPNSFTGQDVIELHLHGSIAVSKIILSVLSKIQHLRMAEPGEFTKLAFLNGKINLIDAEGLGDLLDAQTDQQHWQAIKQLSGELSSIYQAWREQLLSSLAYIEAIIDFPDEEIPQEIISSIKDSVEVLKSQISQHLNDNKRGQKLRQGLSLAIFGPPNVGKSSLINYLSQRQVAIVSDVAGTTRDLIESFIDIGGYPISLIDSAGIRSACDDKIEQEGISLAIEAAKNTDIKLLLIDTTSDFTKLDQNIKNLIDADTIIVVNKIDLSQASSDIERSISISIKTRTNLESLLNAISSKAEQLAGVKEHPSLTRTRHRQNLELALISLQQLDLSQDIVIAAEDLRNAATYLQMLTGKISPDEILGQIFSSFCIGK